MTAIRKQLPIGYADKLLDIEIRYKLTDKPSDQLFFCLMKLYQIGLEHFQSLQSYKHLYFKLKLNEVLISSNTQIIKKLGEDSDFNTSTTKKKQRNDHLYSIMKKSNKCDSKPKVTTVNQLKKIQSRTRAQSYRRQQLIQNTKQSTTRQTIKRMINQNQIKELAKQKKVLKQISTQEEILFRKLQQRQSRKENNKLQHISMSTLDISTFQRSNTQIRNQMENPQIQYQGLTDEEYIKSTQYKINKESFPILE